MRATSQASSNGIDAADASGGRLGPHSSGMTRARRCGRPWRASRASLVGHGHEANGLLLRADLLRRARPRFRVHNLVRFGRLPSGSRPRFVSIDLRGLRRLRSGGAAPSETCPLSRWQPVPHWPAPFGGRPRCFPGVLCGGLIFAFESSRTFVHESRKTSGSDRGKVRKFMNFRSRKSVHLFPRGFDVGLLQTEAGLRLKSEVGLQKNLRKRQTRIRFSTTTRFRFAEGAGAQPQGGPARGRAGDRRTVRTCDASTRRPCARHRRAGTGGKGAGRRKTRRS